MTARDPGGPDRSDAQGFAAAGLSTPAGRAVLGAAVCGSALAYMSDDMLNVALPSLADDLDVGVSSVQWVVNGYFLTMLALMLVAGSIGDRRGHRRTFLDGLAVFSVGAVVCATAPAVPVLVGGRAIQGIGAALVLASGLALVHSSFAEEERSRAVGLYMGFTAISTAVGPMLGGLLVDTVSWRSIFVAPLLLPAIGAVITVVAVREAPTDAGRRPDGRGTVLAFLTIASFSVALIRGPKDWFAPDVLMAMVIAIVAGTVFVGLQRRAPDPMLPLRLFANSTFAGGNLVTLLSFTASAGAFFFVVVHLQSTLGFGAAEAGAALIPLYVIMMIGSPLAGALADRIGPLAPILGGLSVFAGGAWWLSLVDEGSGYVTEILPGVVVLAVGLAALGAPLTAATLDAAGEDEQGIASGVNNTAGQLAGLLMIAVLPAAAGLSDATLDGPAFAQGYGTAMRICAGLALASAVVAGLTIRSTPTDDLED